MIEGRVSAMDELGNVIYLGGVITSINGIPDVIYRAVAVDTTTGMFNPNWLPNFGEICTEVLAIKATPTKIFLGAEANNLAGSQRRFFMAVSPAVITPVPEAAMPAVGLHVWPNPANDRFTLIFSEQGTPWSVTITDALGRVVQLSGPIVGDRAEFDRGDLPAGMYVVRVAQAGRTSATARFVLDQ